MALEASDSLWCDLEEQPDGWLPLPASLRLLVAHRHLLAATTINDVRARYAGSLLGLGWLAIYPLLLLSVYAVVYLFIFKVRFALFDSEEYVAVIFCGLIPFLCFAESIAIGLQSVTSNSKLVKNTLFPIELIPIKAVLGCQCSQAVGLALLCCALAWMGVLSPWAICVLPIWALQVAFLIGLAWFLSSWNVFVRDLPNIVSLSTIVLMMLSPIAYTEDMVPAGLELVTTLNPLSFFIGAYRDCLIFGRCPGLANVAVLTTVSSATFLGGYWVFTRLKPIFNDHV